MDLVKVPVFARLGIAQSPVTQLTASITKPTGVPTTEPTAGQPKASEAKPEAKAEPKPEAIGGLNSAPKVEPKHEAKAKTRADLTPRIAKRAYELYEEGGRKEGAAVQNWQTAETEIRKDLVNTGPPRETKAETKPEAKEQPQSVTKMEPQPEIKAAPKPEKTTEPLTEAHAETPSDVPPQLVKRVHELYEELGRQDVRAVQDFEKAQGEIRKDHSAEEVGATQAGNTAKGRKSEDEN